MATNEDVPRYLSQDENVAQLVGQLRPEDRQSYESLKHIYTEAAFFERRFLVIRTAGKTASGPKLPEILTELVVTDFNASLAAGCRASLLDARTDRVLQVGYVPAKLFDFPVFVSIPVYQGVKWEAREMGDGSYRRNLVFGMCFKQKSAVRFYNRGEVAVVTRNEYRKHFGDTLPRY